MTLLTLEHAKTLSNQELHSIIWDWYRDLTGTRPRHIKENDRDAMINFIEYELRPEVIKMREQEWEKESKMLEEMEKQYASKLEHMLKMESDLENCKITINFNNK